MVSAAHLLEMLPLTTGGTILHHTFFQTEEQMRFLLQGGKEGRRKDESLEDDGEWKSIKFCLLA